MREIVIVVCERCGAVGVTGPDEPWECPECGHVTEPEPPEYDPEVN